MSSQPVVDQQKPSTSNDQPPTPLELRTLSDYVSRNARAFMDDVSVPNFTLSCSDIFTSFINDPEIAFLAVKRDQDSASLIGYNVVSDLDKLEHGNLAVVFVKKFERLRKGVPLREQIRVFSIDDDTSYNSLLTNLNLFTYYKSRHQQSKSDADLESADTHLEQAEKSFKELKKATPKPSVMNTQRASSKDNEEEDSGTAYTTESEEEFDDSILDEEFPVPDLSGLILRHRERNDSSLANNTAKQQEIESDQMDCDNDQDLPSVEQTPLREEQDKEEEQVSTSEEQSLLNEEDIIEINEESNSGDVQSDENSNDAPSSENAQSNTDEVQEDLEDAQSTAQADSVQNSPVGEETEEIRELAVDDEKASLDQDIFSPIKQRKRKNDRRVDDSDDGIVVIDLEDEEEIEPEPVKKKPRRVYFETDSEEDMDSEDEVQIIHEVRAPKKSQKLAKKPRKHESTLRAEKEERERIMRVARKQKKFNGIIFDDKVTDLDQALADTLTAGRTVKALLLDDCNGVQVEVHPSLVRYMKDYQMTGVQFLYNCSIESVDRLNKPGSGGILAHCMGLGKSLTTIAFLHSIMTHNTIGAHFKHVLIVCPVNVVLNWRHEFMKWQKDVDSKIYCGVLTTESPQRCLKILKTWFESPKPTVIIIGYEKLRGFLKKNAKSKLNDADMQQFKHYLQNPGPDLVICDESHTIKEVKSHISQVINKIRTARRICLTGTPLQNNLKEYYTLVNFVKPNLLGTVEEFRDKFEKPIKNGQTADADAYDVKKMKRQCHVLYRKLQQTIDRRDYDVLHGVLPPKHEYAISLRLTPKQINMYRKFLDYTATGERRKMLFNNYITFIDILSHPCQVRVRWEERQKKLAKEEAKKKAKEAKEREQQSKERSTSIDLDSDLEDTEQDADKDTEQVNENNGEENDDAEQARVVNARPWFEEEGILDEAQNKNDIELSYKLKFLVETIKKCEEVGDKMLIFSTCLPTLRRICEMLASLESTWFDDNHEAILKRDDEKWGWQKDKDYMMITGSVRPKQRDIIQKDFNSQNSARNRLCLISTKAGSLGTNFTAANRVVIFDQSWNPSYDRQAMFRAFRIGQTKPVYIYRLVGFGTIENQIYARQITKDSIARRVIDEHQIKRHYRNGDLEELYRLELSEYDPDKVSYAPPDDLVLVHVLSKIKEAVVKVDQYDMLLAHLVEEMLNEDEMKEAWEEFSRAEALQLEKEKLKAAKNNKDTQPSTTNISATENVDQGSSATADASTANLNQTSTLQTNMPSPPKAAVSTPDNVPIVLTVTDSPNKSTTATNTSNTPETENSLNTSNVPNKSTATGAAPTKNNGFTSELNKGMTEFLEQNPEILNRLYS